MRPLPKETRKIKSGTNEYIMKMIDIPEEEFETSINFYNHKDGVQKSIASFSSYKANVITVNFSGKKDDDKKKPSEVVNEPDINIRGHCKKKSASRNGVLLTVCYCTR